MKSKVFFVLLLSIAMLGFSASGWAKKQDGAPRMDVVFLIDTTGSMGDEIAQVKESIVDMITEIEGGKPAPDVRFGLVLYRDRGDEYVTKKFDLTRDTDEIVKSIRDIKATGGGDTPESVNEALYVAIQEMNWDKDIDTDKTIFLIGDARPKIYDNDYRWEDEVKKALDRYIIINSIGCSGLSSDGVDIFTKIAKGSEGSFRFLTYRGEYVAEDGSTRSVMMAGDEYYAMGEEAPEGLWKMGADEAEKKGLTTKAEAPSSSGGRYDLMDGGGYSGDMALLENNLDSILTSGIKEKMMEKGVTYGDPVPFEVVYSGYVDSSHEDREIKITNRPELETSIEELGLKKTDIPTLDFKKDVVFGIVVNSDKHLEDITVDDVRLEGDVVNITLNASKGASKGVDSSPLILISVSAPEKVVANYYFLK